MERLPEDEVVKPKLVSVLNDKISRAQAEAVRHDLNGILCPLACRANKVAVMLLSKAQTNVQKCHV